MFKYTFKHLNHLNTLVKVQMALKINHSGNLNKLNGWRSASCQ